MEYATVSLLNQADSAVITGVVTGPDGKFNIETVAGSYIVQVQFISYKAKYFSATLTKENPRLNLSEVKLLPDTETLEEVVVKGKKSQMT
ncbi:MAG: carboxypeptidase-like regulatory domain-containing protein, partial [Cyclobacteriaceae bacterium]